MSSEDMKAKFAERIKKRKEQMHLSSTVEDNSKSSTTPKASATPEASTPSKASADDQKTKFAERIKQRRSQLGLDAEVSDSFISSFLSDANDYFSNAQKNVGSLGFSTAASIYDSQVDSVKDLRKRYGAISRHLRNHKDSYSTDDYEKLSSTMKSVNSYLNQYQDTFYNAKNFFSQWENEDDYNAWQKKESFVEAYLEDPDKATSTLDYENGWLKEAQRRAEESKILGAEDFQDYGQYTSTKLDGLWDKAWSQYSMGYGDLTYEYINNQDNIRSEIKRKNAAYSSDTKIGSGFDLYDHMTDNEVSVYNYYYAKEGKKRAEEYLYSIEGTLEARANNEMVEKTTAFANAHPVLSSVLSVGTSLGSGFEYIEDVLDYGADKITGKDARLGTNEAALMTNTVRGTVQEKVDWEIGNWDAFDFLYSTAMSGADSLTAGLVFGNLGGTVLGLSAAAQGTNDALTRGMSDGQAFWNGLFSGVFEGLFETVSIGNFNKLKEVAPESIKDIFKNLGKSMLVNASEETLTEIANIGYDTLLNGEFANYTWEELKNGAWKDAVMQVVEAGASGALMGVGMSAVGSASGYKKGSNEAKQVYGNDPGKLVNEALEINPDNAYAQKMQGKLDRGKSLSGGQLMKLNNQIVEGDMNSIQKAAAQRLTELGETGNVEAIAAALAKRFSGQELTRKESGLIQNSQYGRRVSTEMNPQNIQSGDYSSEWAEQIGTHRINVQEYSRMLQAAQQPQEATETTGEQVAAEAQNMAQPAQVEPEMATVQDSLQVAEDGVTRQVSTGKEVKPKKIVSIDGGKVMIQTDNGTVAADDIEFGDRDTDLLWRGAVSFNGINTSGANGVIHAYRSGQPVATYLSGAAQEFRNGYYNMESGGEYADKLTAAQCSIIYELGQKAAGENTAKAQAKATAAKKQKETVSKTERVGEVHFERKGRTFDAKRETALNTMEQLSKVLGIEFYVFESYVNEAGQRVYKNANGNEVHAPNGYYDPSDGSIHIDLNAGADGKGTMLFTIAHELTHFIWHWSPAKFKVLANFLVTQYGEKGASVDELVQRQIAKAERNGRTVDYDTAFEDMVADSMEAMLTDGNVVQVMADLKQQDKRLWQKICQWFKNLAADIKALVDAYKGVKPDSVEGRMVAQMQDVIVILEALYADALVDASENFQAARAQKNTTQEGGVDGNKYSIREGMTEAERYEELKDKKITVISDSRAADYSEDIASLEALQKKAKSKAEKIIKPLAKKLGIINTPLSTTDVETEFLFTTSGGLAESMHKQLRYGGSYVDFAKTLINLDHVLETAVLIEVHGDKYTDTVRANEHLEAVYVLFGAFKDGNSIIPVQMEIKKSSDVGGRLYLTVAMTKIEAGVLGSTPDNGQASSLIPASEYSLAEIFSKINPQDKHFLKYLPDGFLSDEQIEAKKAAVAEDTTRIAGYRTTREKFSDRDSDGNELSEEQKEYFKDSKVRDEQGRLLAMYHGTPNGGFTKFRSGTYFTQNATYADVYQNPGASSISTKKGAEAPMTYKVYLDIKKPFDTRNTRERRIFQQEFYRKYGTGTPLADSGVPDWVDGMDLQEFIEEMEYDYDGLILDEGGTGGYGDEVVSRGLSYVVFDPAQVKDVSNKAPTDDPDIRYSEREDSMGRTLSDGQAEYFKDSQARDNRGRLLTLYHQTENDFTVFDPRRKGAGASDNATPFGIFMKTSSGDIGLRGQRQMELYANITNPLYAYNREALTKQLEQLSPEYAVLMSEHRELDNTYHAKFEEAKNALRSFMLEWRKNNTSAGRRDLYDVPEFNALYEAEDAVVEEWTAKADVLSKRAKETLTQALRDAGYDGVILANDTGSFGRSTDAYIALDPEQVKNVDNKTPTDDPDIRYSDRDSDGNDLTKEQNAFFAQSKVRDKDGKLLVMYHGTKNGDFTVFDRTKAGKRTGFAIYGKGNYFTVFENGAANYGSRVIPAYLKIENPIITSAKTGAFAADVAEALGIKATEISSQTVSERIKEAGYDGVIVYGVGEDEGNIVICVAYDSAQIKEVSNKNPTSNPDIRYSERDPELEKVNRVLEKENAALKHDMAYLKEMLKLQKQVTGGTKFTKTSVEAAAGQLMKYANAKGDRAELAKLVNGVYEYIAKGEELTWDGVVEMAQPAVEWLKSHVNTKKQRSSYAEDVLREIRGSRISLDELQKKEVAYQYGSVNEFRKRAMGSVILTDKASTSLDSQWHEWALMYPNIFDPEINSNDMPAALLDAFDTLRSMTEMEGYAYDEELVGQDLLRQVYDSYWNVSTLYTVADKAQKEINKLKYEHSKRMGNLRQFHREKTAQLKDEHREALQKVKQAERDRLDKKLQETQNRYEQSKKKSAENRRKTEMRRKIRRTIMDLNKILYRGDKKRNVKEDMKDMVAEALRSADILFTDNYTGEDMIRSGVGTELTEQEAKYMAEAQSILAEIESAGTLQDRQEAENRLQGKLDYRMGKLKEVFVREKARLNKATVSEVLGGLADAYKSLENSEQDYVKGAFDENVYQYLMAMKSDVGGTIVKDMSLYQLEELHKAYTMVLTTVRNANKMFAANMKQTREQLGSQTIHEVKQAGGEHGLWLPGEDKVNAFSWNNQKPVYAFERIGSPTLTKLFGNTRAGEDTWAQDMTEAREYYLEQSRKFKYDKWDFTKQYKFTSTSGIDFSLNLEQIMSLYAYSKREQAHDHLMKGGFVFDGNTEVQVNKMGIKVTYLNKTAKAHNVSPEILGEIVSKLSAEQKAFVDEMQEYLSSTMGGKGNEVSMQMYGVELFKEKYYFPLRSAGQYMERAKEADLKKQQGQISIANSGFTKATTPKSSNPVVLSGFMDVWADHVNEMSMYHSFVLPMEDFRRVYNYSSPNMETGQSISVNSVIQDAYGEAATGYIDQLYRDLNGGAVSDPRENWAKKWMGKFKKAAVFASLSVVIQQPSAIGRAFAIIDPKYFVGGKVGHKRHKALWAELKKYAPVAVIKEMGYFDTGMGKSAQDFIKGKEYNTIKEKAAALFTDGDYRDELLGKAPALADELTWCSIWEAAKRETKAKNPKMDVRSEEFLQMAGERFTEVITKTQVYDSVLSRSANMRSKAALMSMLTAFMAEPTTTINMVEDALRKGKKGDRKYAARAMGAALGSVMLNSILSSLVYAMRDDDEDETFLEKYVQSFATEILDGVNPLTYYPLLKDIWSALQGFDIERSDMSLITSLTEALTKLVQVYSKDTNEMDEEELAEHNKRLADAWWGVVDYVTALVGIPVKNVRRDINGIVSAVSTIAADLTDRDTSWGSLLDKTWDSVKNSIPVVGWLPDKTAADKLYKATVSGDTAYRNRLASSYASENSLNSAIRKGLRTNDSRIWEAAMAWNNNDLESYKRIAREIVAEGNFSQDNVVMAIQAEAKAMLPSETESTTSKAKGYFTAEKFAVAIAQGNSNMAREIKADIVATAQNNGKTEEEAEKNFASSATSDLKEMYLAGDLSEQEVVSTLTTYCSYTQDKATEMVTKWRAEKETGIVYDDIDEAFMDGEISEGDARNMYITYGGYSKKDAAEKVTVLAFVKKNPECEGISYAAIENYQTNCEAFGVPAATFYDAWKYNSDTKADVDANGDSISGSKKVKVLAYINRMVLTKAQKDSLYYAFGWAESKIDEAPWR